MDQTTKKSVFGGRKFGLSIYALSLVPVLAMLGAPGEAYIAVGTVTIAFCGGNAVVEWRHAPKV